MRILHVTAGIGPRLGGAAKAALDMVAALTQHGAEIVMFSVDLDEPGHWLPFARTTSRTAADFGHIDGVEATLFAVRWPSRFAYAPDMSQALRQRIGQFDLVHIHQVNLFPTLAASFYARRSGVPYLIQPHGAFDTVPRSRKHLRKALYNHLVERRNLDSAAAIQYTSTRELQQAAPLKIRAPAVVIPLGVPLADFRRLPPRGKFRARHPVLRESTLIVTIGRLAPDKGLDLLAKAFAVVARERPHAHLVIVGPDEDGFGDKVSQWLRDECIDNRTTITGALLGAEKMELLADTDVYVQASYSESFGLAAVEAMASGRPIVITDKVAIHQEIVESGAGLAVPCDPSEIASALTRILDNASFARQLGINGRALAAAHFDSGAVAEQQLRLYDGILKAR